MIFYLFLRWIKRDHRDDVLKTVGRIIAATPDRNHPFKDGMPGNSWFRVSIYEF